MPSASSTVIVTAGCSLLAYGAFLLSTSSPSQKQQSQTLLSDIDDIDDNNNINEEDFNQRFRVANEFRQDKQGQLDPAILEMISKLYT